GALQHAAHCVREAQHEVGRDGRLADGPADAVRAEIGPAHGFVPCCAALHTLSAATVSLTSCTRTIVAPLSAASSAAATLGTMRSCTCSPVTLPRLDLR